MDTEILSVLFQKGFNYFQGFKGGDSLNYEFSTRYNLKGDSIGITVDDSQYELRMYRREYPSSRIFTTKGDLLQFLRDVG